MFFSVLRFLLAIVRMATTPCIRGGLHLAEAGHPRPVAAGAFNFGPGRGPKKRPEEFAEPPGTQPRYAHVHVHTYIHIYLSIYVSIYLSIYLSMCIYTYVNEQIQLNINIFLYICLYEHTCDREFSCSQKRSLYEGYYFWVSRIALQCFGILLIRDLPKTKT